jgi:hypothetical protein
VAVGDFNGDGIPDLAVTEGGSVGVLLGNGDGTFRPRVDYDAGYATSLAVGDFNGDGIPDVAVANAFGTVRVLLGNGDGSFQPTRVSYVAGAGPLSVVTADFDRDGRPDLAVPDVYSNNISILLNDGSWPGGGAPGATPRRRPAPPAPDRFAAAALRPDGGTPPARAAGPAAPADGQRPPVPPAAGPLAPAGATPAGSAELPAPTRLGAAARAGRAPWVLTDLVFADLADGAALLRWAAPDHFIWAT